MTLRLASLSLILVALAGCSSDDSPSDGGTNSSSSSKASSSTSTSTSKSSSSAASSTSSAASSTSSVASSTSGAGCTFTSGSGLAVSGNYVTSGSLKGYGWGFTTPVGGGDGVNCTTGTFTNLCMSGTLGADSTYKTVAGLGFNVNQASSGDPNGSAYASAITSVTYSYSGSTTNGVRLQVSDATSDYCTTLTASSGTIPIASFVTNCYTGGTPQTPFSGSGLTKIQLIVPGSTSAVTITNLCLDSVSVQ